MAGLAKYPNLLKPLDLGWITPRHPRDYFWNRCDMQCLQIFVHVIPYTLSHNTSNTYHLHTYMRHTHKHMHAHIVCIVCMNLCMVYVPPNCSPIRKPQTGDGNYSEGGKSPFPPFFSTMGLIIFLRKKQQPVKSPLGEHGMNMCVHVCANIHIHLHMHNTCTTPQ